MPVSLSPRRLRYSDHLIVLATLCLCVDRFADVEVSGDESARPADLTSLPADWALSHSQLLHVAGIEMDPDDEENTSHWLSSFVISEQEEPLVRTLADAIGPDVLFASLWAIGHGAPSSRLDEDEFGDPLQEVLRFPLETDRLEGILQFDTSFDKMRMFEWLQEICHFR
ncbi:hypothetical protein BKA23_2643 [Rudaeicoccus suwonensis]|uniref:Uncharacterized protein n=1 Tax=Rudaeicoccus suwonensis TaxID=657409 RepID=A0A561E3U9_9MICO|nr:hypothetical protein BKA23_2643 [Rudaeicoccus suwonensis]